MYGASLFLLSACMLIEIWFVISDNQVLITDYIFLVFIDIVLGSEICNPKRIVCDDYK